MRTALHVTILGTSVVMAGVARALAAQPGLDVCIVECTTDLPLCLSQICLDILIFDLAAVTAEEVGVLVDAHSALTLIGIDIASLQARTFSSRACSLTSLDDLVQLLDRLHILTNAVSRVAAQ